MTEENDQGFATEESGGGLADSPEEVVPDAPQEKDPDAGPTETAEQVEEDSERDQAEG
jgi:hypothetical protein